MPYRRSKWNRWLWCCVLLSPFGMGWLMYAWITQSGLQLCLFRKLTGHLCPLCGLTHAFALAMQGEFRAATQFHPLWWCPALLMVGAGVCALWDALFETDHLGKWHFLARTPIWLWFVILAMLVWWRAGSTG